MDSACSGNIIEMDTALVHPEIWISCLILLQEKKGGYMKKYVHFLAMMLFVVSVSGLLSDCHREVQSRSSLESAGMNGTAVAQAGTVSPGTADTSGIQPPGSVTPRSPTPVPGEPSSPVPGVPQTPVPGEPSAPVPGTPVPGAATTPTPGTTTTPTPGTGTAPAPGTSSGMGQ